VSEIELDKCEQRVAYLMNMVPQSRSDYLLLILLYWQVFDGIDIPEEVVKRIQEHATQPETITRSRRKVSEQLKLQQLLEFQRMT
jgi:predicted glycosyl hydrolase (DUF1957 family)